jgi:hypothetical protein
MDKMAKVKIIGFQVNVPYDRRPRRKIAGHDLC